MISKSVRKIVTLLALAVLLVQAGMVGALAAEDYTYTVRIYAGNNGTIGGGSVATYTARYGDTIGFSPEQVTLTDERYYVRGIRESGRDNNTVSSNVIYVTEDADYVVAYGIKGELVTYTVNYVDEAGATLAPSQTYYGNAGDKPVVAYLYIENYIPQALNLTRTLTDNAAGNVFTFVYTYVGPVVNVENQTAEMPEEGEGDAGAADAGDAGAADAGAADAGDAGAADAGDAGDAGAGAAPDDNAAPEEAPEEAVIDENATPLDETPEIIDLDEEDTPLGTLELTDSEKEEQSNKTKFFGSIGFILVAVAALGGLVAALVVKKRKKT